MIFVVDVRNANCLMSLFYPMYTFAHISSISLQIFPIEFLTNLYLQFFTFHQWSQMGPFAPFCETMVIMLKATQGQSVF